MFREKWGLSFSSGVDYFLSDNFDGSVAGRFNDFSWSLNVGVKLYLNNYK